MSGDHRILRMGLQATSLILRWPPEISGHSKLGMTPRFGRAVSRGCEPPS